MVVKHNGFNCIVPRGPPKRHYYCPPAHENLPMSIIIGAANAPDGKYDDSIISEISYNPAHLRAWHIQPELMGKLPGDLLRRLLEMQRAGAAVLTSFERLGEIQEDLEIEEERRLIEKQKDKGTLLSPTLPVPHSFRSAFSGVDDAVSIATEATAGSVSSTSNDSSSSNETARTTLPSSRSSMSDLTAKGKPNTLTAIPSDTTGDSSGSAAGKKRHSFHSTPITTLTIRMEATPARSKYSAERFHLRTEALIHLTDSVRMIDRELYEYDVVENQNDSEFTNKKIMTEAVYEEFEQWYRGKKAIVRALVERVQGLGAEKFNDEL